MTHVTPDAAPETAPAPRVPEGRGPAHVRAADAPDGIGTLRLPDFALVVLIGATGAGKSTFAARHFLDTEVVSSDRCRAIVGDDPNDQSVTAPAFALAREIVRARLALRRFTVVDATNVREADRRGFVDIAKEYHALPVAVVVDPGEDVAVARNRARPDRPDRPSVVRGMRREIRRGLKGLRKEGFRFVAETDGVEPLRIVREPLWVDRRDLVGPFDVIGDVHGCADELDALLRRLGYTVEHGDGPDPTVAAPHGRTAVFVGDLVDRGPDSPRVLRTVMAMHRAGIALAVAGNHDDKLARALAPGSRVVASDSLAATLTALATEPEGFAGEVRAFLGSLPSHLWLDGGDLCVAHAGLPEAMVGRASGAVRAHALYGDVTGEKDADGHPVRRDWAATYRGAAHVVHGHVVVPEAEWRNRTIDLDTGCVFGGRLTALTWPERDLVSVPADRIHWGADGASPLATAVARKVPDRHDRLPDIEDVSGTRRIATALGPTVRIDGDRTTTAVGALARFGIDPRWLCHLPPTISPVAASDRDGWLERPEEAFDHYRRAGVTDLVVEEKHMGSRGILAVCRDREAAARRFGDDGRTGRVWTRNGRPFFRPDTEAEVVARMAERIGAAGLWDEWGSDWCLLDAEILPWNLKAEGLVADRFAATGAAATLGLTAVAAAFARLADRGIEGADAVVERATDRLDRARAFDRAWRPFVGPTDGVDDVRVAVFHVLATEGNDMLATPNDRHMAWADALRGDPDAPEGIARATRWTRLDADDPDAVRRVVEEWERTTVAGHEGVVVKPRAFVERGKAGRPLQPALKVRGREYLRIVYGPDYDAPGNLERLKDRKRERSLGTKRRLAVDGFALGREAVSRFVAGEPLRSWHECVLGVLALDAEPVDPRL